METENKYQRGKIYTIRNPDSEKYYIGSTCEKYLSNRFGGHKSNYKKYLNGKYGNSSSFKLFELGIDDCYIELLELFPCNSRLELERREGELIRLHKNDVVNRCIVGRTDKEYYQDNKDKLLEQMKEYYQDNRDKKLEKGKIKYICECGSELRKSDKARHEQTKKHIAYIDSK